MRLALIFISVLVIASCYTRKGRTENADRIFSTVVKKAKEHNDTSTDRKVVLQIKNFNPTKLLLSELSKEISNSKDLVYLFTWNNDLPTVTLRFSAILLDRSANKKYYVFNLKGERNIQITDQKPANFDSHNFVLDRFLIGQVDTLYAWQNSFSSAQMGQDYSLFRIDLSKPEVDLLHLSSVVVMQH